MLNIINKLVTSNDLRIKQVSKLHSISLKVRSAGAITGDMRPLILSLSLILSLPLSEKGNIRNTLRINGILESMQMQFHCRIYTFI
jgi:hypothetical protein